TSDVRPDRPPRVPRLRAPPLRVLEGRPSASAPCHRRGGALHGVSLLRRPPLPRLQGLSRAPPGERQRGKRGGSRLPCWRPLAFPARAARVGHVLRPRDQREQGLWRPPLPHGGARCGCPIPLG